MGILRRTGEQTGTYGKSSSPAFPVMDLSMDVVATAETMAMITAIKAITATTPRMIRSSMDTTYLLALFSGGSPRHKTRQAAASVRQIH